jgi:hypothetical protein
MRIVLAFVILAVLALLVAAPAVAFADATYGPDGCYDEGGCDNKRVCIPVQDLGMPSDMTHPPLDLRGTIDARRERRSRQRAAGAGLVALCGFALFGVAAARHFVRS